MTDKPAAGNYSVLKPLDFLKDIETEASRAKQRVWVQAMYIAPGKITDRVSGLLSAASEAGVDARLQSDWYSTVYINGRRMLPVLSQDERARNMASRLRNAGVTVTITNRGTGLDHLFPYKGRNHMKLTVIDDIAYIGGLNYADSDFGYDDFMVKIRSKALADALALQFLRSGKGTLRDQKVRIDHETTLMVDSGQPGFSRILDEAVTMAGKSAESIYHTSQLAPDGRFLTALREAHIKKRKVEVLVPKHNAHSSLFSALNNFNRLLMKGRRKAVPVLVLRRMIHAKLTIVDGKYALIGSHNLSALGVGLGTAEIALISSNPKLVSNLKAYYSETRDSA